MELKAEIRTQKGKSGVKKLSYLNKVPAILYGHNETPVLLQISEEDTEHLKEGEHLTLDFGKKVDTIIKEIQWHPITFAIQNIDFLILKKGEKVKVKVPLVIEGMAAIIKKGGIIEHKLSEIEIECLPQEIPDELKVDVSNLNIGNSVCIKDLPPIKGKFMESPETLVLSILAPKKEEEVKPAEAEVTEEGAAGAEAGAEAGAAGAKAEAKPAAGKAGPEAKGKPEAKAGAAAKPAAGKAGPEAKAKPDAKAKPEKGK